MRAFVSGFFCLVLLASACGGNETTACNKDEDCAAATCCHATGAVNQDSAPDCTELDCTSDYRACTTDDEAITPVCNLGTCELNRPPWCVLADGAG